MQNHEIIDIHTHTFPDAIAKETVCSLEGRSHTHSFSDGTVEGLRHKTAPMFCVQYHPEAAPGPHDPFYLFRRFKEMLGR